MIHTSQTAPRGTCRFILSTAWQIEGRRSSRFWSAAAMSCGVSKEGKKCQQFVHRQYKSVNKLFARVHTLT